MSIDRETVKKVGMLARLHLEESDLDLFTPQVAGILKWVEALDEVDTTHVAPLACVTDITPHLRADCADDGGIQADILSNAPESAEGFFVVPKVVE